MDQRRYKEGIQRDQGFVLPPSIEEYVSPENPVRAIDSYVGSLDLEELGFQHAGGQRTCGQPAFSPQALLRLYLYGYLHRIRSSRRLEAECQRNLEVIWLVEGLCPGYKTIADFRKANLQALQAVNRDFVQVCKELDLFGAELVGIDGSHFRGNASKSRIYNAQRLQRALKRVEADITHYLHSLDQADEQECKAGESGQTKTQLEQKLQALRERQEKRQAQLAQLEASGEKQISEVDEDARWLNKGGQTVAGYNVQTAVDAKHKLIVVSDLTQDSNDERQLAPMGLAAKAVLGVEKLDTIQDAGYFNVQHIKLCQENGITPWVAEPEHQAYAQLQGRYRRDEFVYDAQTNGYRCPAGQNLPYCGDQHKSGKTIWRYQSSPTVCAQCPLRQQCLPAKVGYRSLTRWEHEDIIEAHRLRMQQEGAAKMRQRSGLCEHPFGTLKAWCGWSHFLLRGFAKVRAELSLLTLSYNFKRVLSILGLSAFRAYCLHRRRASSLVNPV